MVLPAAWESWKSNSNTPLHEREAAVAVEIEKEYNIRKMEEVEVCEEVPEMNWADTLLAMSEVDVVLLATSDVDRPALEVDMLLVMRVDRPAMKVG